MNAISLTPPNDLTPLRWKISLLAYVNCLEIDERWILPENISSNPENNNLGAYIAENLS